MKGGKKGTQVHKILGKNRARKASVHQHHIFYFFSVETKKCLIVTGYLFFLILFCLVLNVYASEKCNKQPSNFFLYDTIPQSKNAGVDYVANLKIAFKKDPRGLGALFKLSAAGVLDGVGADAHSDVLWHLLECWGDKAYANVLSKESQLVRDEVMMYLDYEGFSEGGNWSKKYPLTYSQGNHERSGH